MSNKFNNVIIFAVGAAIGAVVTWKVVSAKYEKLIQEEVDSVKEAFHNREGNIPCEGTDESTRDTDESNCMIVDSQGHPVDLDRKPSLMDYAKVLGKENYVDYSTMEGVHNRENKKEEVDEPVKQGNECPYVIEPDDFGEYSEYETVTLVYYSDGILEDDMGTILDEEDIAETVGSDFMLHFGEYEDDSVFIRNDARKTDYEILRDNQRYTDVTPETD